MVSTAQAGLVQPVTYMSTELVQGLAQGTFSLITFYFVRYTYPHTQLTQLKIYDRVNFHVPTTHHKEWHQVISVPFEDSSPQTSLALHNCRHLYFCLCPFLCLPHASQISGSSILPSPHRYSLPFLCFLPLGDPFSLITPTPFLCDSLSISSSWFKKLLVSALMSFWWWLFD